MFYKHVDVFTQQPFSGNSLTIFIVSEMLETRNMQKIAQEMRHFESIFLLPLDKSKNEYGARIFTTEEELDFAGHPLIGAACALHDEYHSNLQRSTFKFKLNTRELDIKTLKSTNYYSATMNQGIPNFIKTLTEEERDVFLQALNLSIADLDEHLPLEVISTGLRYLIVPIKTNIETAKIIKANLGDLLAGVGADFVYIYDIINSIGRTWDNTGLVEDAATGSAVGPLGAYLIKYGLANIDETIIINQGQYSKRPSKLYVKALGTIKNIDGIEVSGDVCVIGEGKISARL